MDHASLEKQSSTTPMLNDSEKMVIITSSNGPVGKILLREDTILTNLQSCGGCGRAHFKCGVNDQLTALCWGKDWDTSVRCLASLWVVFVLSFMGTVLFCFTDAFNSAVLSNMILRNNSQAFMMWKHPTVRPLMKVHIFNYTNWHEVRADPTLKLKVEDIGPFVYEQDIERVGVEFEGDELLSFQERNKFTFLPSLSAAPEYEKLTVPNLPLMAVVSMTEGLGFYLQSIISGVLNMANHPNAFITEPVHRFLWGYSDSIISAARPILSIIGKLPQYDDFGLLAAKNGTLRDRITINTGINDYNKMNLIERFNGQEQLDFWTTPECNSIEASDGSIFPPSQLNRHTPLNVFLPNLCRRIPFHYEKDVQTSDGIELLRYRMPLDVFDSGALNPHNQCYCHVDSGRCPPSGVVNVTVCTMGVSAMISFPHFYLGDPALRQHFEGLAPDASKHDSYLDIHPSLGIALNGKSSLQINMQVKKSRMQSAVDFLPDNIILPIAWLEVAIEELPEEVRTLVYHGTYSTAAIRLVLTVLCLVLLAISGICLILVLVRRRKPKPCVTIKKVHLENSINANIVE